MTPQEIYTKLSEMAGLPELSICNLHSYCKRTFHCIASQAYPVIDFDGVKDYWCKKQGKTSVSSVDALACTTKSLCMAELKSTKLFFEHRVDYADEHQSDTKKEKLETDIDIQIGKFDFKKKLEDSICICEEMTGIDNMLITADIVYLLVTDVDPEKNPLETLALHLETLAETSTNWEKVYTDKMKKRFKDNTIAVKGIRTFFISCKEFDIVMKKL